MVKARLDNSTIIALLPAYLSDIEDYLSLSSVSHHIRTELYANTSPHQHLQLAYASRRVFLRPNPLFLLTHLIKALSTWSSYSPDNLRRFIEAIWRGDESVLELAVSIPQVAVLAGWTADKPRELWEWRMRVVVPLTDLLDYCVGEQWRGQEDFWNEVEDAVTLEADPSGMVFRLIMYGEVFGGAWKDSVIALQEVKRRDGWAGGQKTPARLTTPLPPHLSLATRMEFVKYLFPDWRLPIHPGSTRSIESDRAIRSDEIVWHRPAASMTDSARQNVPDGANVTSITSKSASPTLQPVLRCTIHPLRDVRTDIGPYETHWTPVYSTNEEEQGWNMTMRPTAEENVESVFHLLARSQRYRVFTRRMFEQVLEHTIVSGQVTSPLSFGDNGYGLLHALTEEVDQALDDDHWSFAFRDCPRQTYRAALHLSGAPWMYGLAGAELLAAHHSQGGSGPSSSQQANRLTNDWKERAAQHDDKRGIQATGADLCKRSNEILRITDKGGFEAVQVGRKTCYEMPCLLAETDVLLGH